MLTVHPNFVCAMASPTVDGIASWLKCLSSIPCLSAKICHKKRQCNSCYGRFKSIGRPDAAADIVVDLQAVADLNRRTGANVDPTADPSELMQSNTRNLMSAISSLPQLTERKKVLDKHTNIASALLKLIQGRALDQYYHREEDCLHGKADFAAIVTLLQVPCFTLYSCMLAPTLQRQSLTSACTKVVCSSC